MALEDDDWLNSASTPVSVLQDEPAPAPQPQPAPPPVQDTSWLDQASSPVQQQPAPQPVQQQPVNPEPYNDVVRQAQIHALEGVEEGDIEQPPAPGEIDDRKWQRESAARDRQGLLNEQKAKAFAEVQKKHPNWKPDEIAQRAYDSVFKEVRPLRKEYKKQRRIDAEKADYNQMMDNRLHSLGNVASLGIGGKLQAYDEDLIAHFASSGGKLDALLKRVFGKEGEADNVNRSRQELAARGTEIANKAGVSRWFSKPGEIIAGIAPDLAANMAVPGSLPIIMAADGWNNGLTEARDAGLSEAKAHTYAGVQGVIGYVSGKFTSDIIKPGAVIPKQTLVQALKDGAKKISYEYGNMAATNFASEATANVMGVREEELTFDKVKDILGETAIQVGTLSAYGKAHEGLNRFRASETVKTLQQKYNLTPAKAGEMVERAANWVESKTSGQINELASKLQPTRGDFEKAKVPGKYDAGDRAAFTEAVRKQEEANQYFDEQFGPEAQAKAKAEYQASKKPLAQQIFEDIGHDPAAIKAKAKETGVKLPPLVSHKEAAELIAKKVESTPKDAKAEGIKGFFGGEGKYSDGLKDTFKDAWAKGKDLPDMERNSMVGKVVQQALKRGYPKDAATLDKAFAVIQATGNGRDAGHTLKEFDKSFPKKEAAKLETVKYQMKKEAVGEKSKQVKASKKEHFPTEEELGREELSKAGMSEDQIQRATKYGLFAKDNVTGFTDARSGPTRANTIHRAIEYITKHAIDGTFADVDIRNLGGLNETFTHSVADKHFKALSDIAHKHLEAVADFVHAFRHGGDELSFVIMGAKQEVVHAALVRAQKEMAEYVKANGLANIASAKKKIGPDGKPEVGTGIHFGLSKIEKSDKVSDVIKSAEHETEARKKDHNYGTRQTETVGSGPSTGSGTTPGDGQDAGRASSKERTGAGEGRQAADRETAGGATPSGATPESEPAKESVKPPSEKKPDTAPDFENEANNKDESGGPKYSMKVQPSPKIEAADVQKAFPGASIGSFKDGSGWRVTFEGGHYVDIKVVEKIAVDWEAAEKGMGRTIPAKERKMLAAAGSFEVVTKDGKKLDGVGLLQLSKLLADSATLKHESLHLAKALGLFTDAEWQTLVNEYSNSKKPLSEQEEDIADARGAWRGEDGLGSRIKKWGKNLLKQFGVTVGADAYEIHQMMDDAEFWKRTPVIQNGKPYVKLNFGRPDLANPAKSQEVRNLVDKADEARKMAGEPGHWVFDKESGVEVWEGVRSDATVQKEAQELLDSHYIKTRNDLLKKAQSGEQLSDVETIAAKEIINREGQKAIKSKNPDRIKQAIALIDAYRRTGTEQARALRQRRDPVESPRQRHQRMLMEGLLTPSEKIRYKIEDARKAGNFAEIDKLQAEWAGKVEEIKYQLKKLGVDADNLESVSDDPVTAAKALGTIQAVKADNWDAVYEYWRNAILSAPPTHAANVIGNTTHATWHYTAERLTEALVNTLAQRPEGMQWGEFKHLLAGVLPGMSRGAKNFILSWKSETPYFEQEVTGKGTAKVEESNVAIEGAKGRVIRIPQRLLLASDEFSKSMFATMEVGAQAYRIAKAEKKTGMDLQKRIQELVDDYESDAWTRAMTHVKELTFQQEPDKISRAVLNVRNSAYPFKYIIPFVTTPYNIFKTGISKSPLGTLSTAIKIHRAVKTGNWEGVPASAAQQVIAWAILLALMSNDEKNPWITGANTSSTTGERSMENRTFPAQSLKVGDTWYSYSRVEPFATVLALSVDGVNALRHLKESPNKALMDSFKAIEGQAHSKTFLSGVSDFINAFEGNLADAPARWASRFTVSWVPNLVRSTGRAVDDYQPERGVWGKGPEWTTRLLKRTIQNTELGFIPDQPAYDLWGRKISRTDTPYGPKTDWLYRTLSPIKSVKENVLVGDRILVNWNNDHPEAEKFPNLPSKTYKVDGQIKYVTDEQYARLLKESGELSRKVVEGWNWKNVDTPSEQDVDTIADSIAAARKVVREQLENEWQGKGTASFDHDALSAKIRAQVMDKHLETLASRRPTYITPDDRVKGVTIQQKQAKFDKRVQESADWLKARGVEPVALRKAFAKHAFGKYQEDKTRQQHFEIFNARLQRFKLAG